MFKAIGLNIWLSVGAIRVATQPVHGHPKCQSHIATINSGSNARKRVDWADVTPEVTALLDRVSLADLQDPKFWPLLTAMVQVRPDKDIFPVRSKYGNDEEQYRLALNYLTSKKPLWYNKSLPYADQIKPCRFLQTKIYPGA